MIHELSGLQGKEGETATGGLEVAVASVIVSVVVVSVMVGLTLEHYPTIRSNS